MCVPYSLAYSILILTHCGVCVYMCLCACTYVYYMRARVYC